MEGRFTGDGGVEEGTSRVRIANCCRSEGHRDGRGVLIDTYALHSSSGSNDVHYLE